MTEYDDEPEHRLGKSTAYPTKKYKPILTTGPISS